MSGSRSSANALAIAAANSIRRCYACDGDHAPADVRVRGDDAARRCPATGAELRYVALFPVGASHYCALDERAG